MLAIVINLASLLLLLVVSITIIKKRIDISILWYCLCMLYFINIPLFFDSIMMSIQGQDRWDYVLAQSNIMWESGLLVSITRVSTVVLFFNFIVIISYFILSQSYRNKSITPREFSVNNFFSWKTYIVLSILTLFVFLYSIGITSISSITKLQFDWVSNRTDNRYIILLSNILLAILPSCALKTMSSKSYFMGIIALLPIFIIEYITEARSLIISLAFYVLFYYVFTQKTISVQSVLRIVIVAVVLVFLMSFFRSSEDFSPYPIERDPSYNDLLYSINNQSMLSTHGNDTKRLLLTGIKSIEAEDITVKLADTKFTIGWGTLHPTIVGWSYIDLGDLYWIMALIMGVILSIADGIRKSLPVKYGFIYYSFIFSFIAVAVRGSVQVAYATFIYPTIIVLIVHIAYSLLKRSKNEKATSN